MRPLEAWFGRLAMSGICMIVTGCGGSDVPDPDSDSRAARVEAPAGPTSRASAPEAPSDSEPKPDPTALARNTAPPEPDRSGPQAKADPASKPEEKPAPTPEPEAEKTPPATKGDSSATDEMLKMSGAQGTPPAAGQGTESSTPPLSGGATPSPSSGTSPSEPGPGSTPGAPSVPNGSTATPNTPAPGSSGLASPGVLPGQGGRSLERETGGPSPRAGGPGAPGPNASGPGPGPGGSGAAAPGPGGFGGVAGPGGPPGADAANAGPAAFNRPTTAVQAFLAALTAKNKDKLAEATAKRAPTEAAEKHRKIFAAIVEGSISDDELDEMARALEGFKVSGQGTAKSTGRIGILVSKTIGREYLQRTIMTRKEKEGWKVLDVESLIDYKPVGSGIRRRK